MVTQTVDWLAQQLVFINLEITCWSGKKQLTPEDLGLDRHQLPPESLVSLGDKQLIDPAALREFTRLRSAARRHCLAVGTRFMGGYAVPVAKAADLLATLDDLENRYQRARTAFLDHYDQSLAAWAAQQPAQWQKLIHEAFVPAEYVGGRLGFAVQAVRVQAPDTDLIDHSGFSDALQGLGAQVFHDIAVMARESLTTSFQGKTAVTRRALSPLRTMRDKLDGLAFVDSRCRSVVAELDRLLTAAPKGMPITGHVLTQICQFLSLAAQPQGLKTWQAHTPVPETDWMGASVPLTEPSAQADVAGADRAQEPDGLNSPALSENASEPGWFF